MDESDLNDDLLGADVTSRNKYLRLGMLIGICCVGFLAVDVVTPLAFNDAFPAIVCVNIVTAQLTVICIWGTLVRGTFWIRLPWTLLLLLVSWFAFACGITVSTSCGAATFVSLGSATELQRESAQPQV